MVKLLWRALSRFLRECFAAYDQSTGWVDRATMIVAIVAVFSGVSVGAQGAWSGNYLGPTIAVCLMTVFVMLLGGARLAWKLNENEASETVAELSKTPIGRLRLTLDTLARDIKETPIPIGPDALVQAEAILVSQQELVANAMRKDKTLWAHSPHGWPGDGPDLYVWAATFVVMQYRYSDRLTKRPLAGNFFMTRYYSHTFVGLLRREIEYPNDWEPPQREPPGLYLTTLEAYKRQGLSKGNADDRS